MSEKPACGKCFFSELGDAPPGTLERALICKRSPPQIFGVLQQTVQGMVTVPASAFPGVQPDSWCHQFKPKNPMAIVSDKE